MTGPTLTTASTTGPHLVLYDGLCGFCSGSVRFILGRDHAGLFHFASLQSAVAAAYLGPFGLSPRDMKTLVVLVGYQRTAAKALTKASAVLFLADTLGWPWRMATAARLAPIALLDRLYDFVAGNRYWLAGRYDQCLVPRPEERARFLDMNERLVSQELPS